MPPVLSRPSPWRTFAASVALTLLATACAQRDASGPDQMSDEALAGLVKQNTEAIKGLSATVGRTVGNGTSGGSADSAPSTGRPSGTPGGTAGIGNGLKFPDSIALTQAQLAQITALRTAASQANAADSVAMQAIMDKMIAARAANAPSGMIDSLFAAYEPVARRLREAAQKLDADILAVLTPAQRAWVAACDVPRALSVEQAQQIADLHEAFARETAADVAAIGAALLKIDSLRAKGSSPATEAQIKEILDQILPARTRLRDAQTVLEGKISAIVGPNACYD